ncbi:MAG: hypothetical protein K6F33_12115 [Bacteroidales bacterium]|nr:hypothetical protein [Bacteroidales bacterium]
MSNIHTLVIGQGAGPAKFGMTEDEIIDLFGQPDEREEEAYDDDPDLKTVTLYYDALMTDFSFDLDEDEDGNDVYKLSSILCTNPEMTIDNKIKFGDSEETVIKYTHNLKAADPEVEVDKETKERILMFDDLSMMAIFDSQGLSAVQIGYWDDEDTEE